VGAHVVRVAGIEAERAPAAGDVGGGHDTVTNRQRPPRLIERGLTLANRLDDADVLVPADERVGGVTFMCRAGVLLGLPSPGVLVRTAYPRIQHAQHDRPRLRIGARKALHSEVPGSADDRGPDLLAHLTAPMVRPRTKCRWTISANRMIGSAPMTPAAAIGPHSIWIFPISVETPTGTVCAFGVEVND